MVSAKWSDGTFYPAKIVKVISKGNRIQIDCIYTSELNLFTWNDNIQSFGS
jgi:hypothetical protein